MSHSGMIKYNTIEETETELKHFLDDKLVAIIYKEDNEV